MKLYAIYNVTLKKYAPAGKLDSKINAGAFVHMKSLEQLEARYWTDRPKLYQRMTEASKQLKYCLRTFCKQSYVLIIVQYTVAPSRDCYGFVDDGLSKLKKLSSLTQIQGVP